MHLKPFEQAGNTGPRDQTDQSWLYMKIDAVLFKLIFMLWLENKCVPSFNALADEAHVQIREEED